MEYTALSPQGQVRISIYSAGNVPCSIKVTTLDDELVEEILERNRVLNARLCLIGGVPDLPETREKLVESLLQDEAMVQGYWQSLDAADRQLFDAYEIRDVEGMRAALQAGADPDLRLLWDGSLPGLRDESAGGGALPAGGVRISAGVGVR